MRIFFFLALVLSLASLAPAETIQRICTCEYDPTPVCGASGRTHGNRCQMACLGDSFMYSGPCSKDLLDAVGKPT